ncbi:MAG: hypothetical protein Kow0022_18590 [Phycisphaerales bacterium]
MSSVQDIGICVRHWDWSETSQTVSVLTRRHGVVRGLAKGSRRERSTFSGGIELLTEGELQAVVKSDRGLATLTGWDLREPFRGLRERLGAFYAGMYMADLVQHLVLDSDPHSDVYDALRNGLAALCNSGVDGPASRRVVLRFQWALLAGVGMKPDLERDVATGGDLPSGDVIRFIPGLGGFSGGIGPDDHQNGWKVRRSTFGALQSLAAGDALPGESEPVERAMRLLGAYVHYLLGKELMTFGPLLKV